MRLQVLRNGAYVPRVQSIQIDKDSTGTSSATITAVMSGSDAAALSALDSIEVLGGQLVTDSFFTNLNSSGFVSWPQFGTSPNWLQYGSVGFPVAGQTSATFFLQPGTVIPDGQSTNSLVSQRIPGLIPGDSIFFSASFSDYLSSAPPAGLSFQPYILFLIHYADGSSTSFTANSFNLTSTFQTASGVGTIPLSSNKISYCELVLGIAVVNSSGAVFNVPNVTGTFFAGFVTAASVLAGPISFAGLLHSIQVTDAPGNNPNVTVSMACRDYKALADAALFTKNYTAAITDQAMIQDILVRAGLTDISANSADIQSIISLTANYSNNTVTEALDAICKASGAVWLITPDKRLRYFDPATANVPAPFMLDSDAPNGYSSFKFGGALNWRQDLYTPANHVLFIGGLDGAGNTITATADNASSKAAYHRTYSSVVRDPTVTTQTAANAAATTYLNQNSNPQQQLSITCWQPGLDVGQIVSINRAKLGWNRRQFAIRKISIQQATADQAGSPQYRTAYQLTLGDYAPSLTQVLKGLTGTTSDMQILNQNVTVNPVVSVPAYAPIIQDSLAIPFPTGNYTGTQTQTYNLVNVTGQAGRLTSVSVQVTGGAIGDSEAGVSHYYLANGATIGTLSVFVSISIDGQPAVIYYPVNGQQPGAGSNCNWDGGLYAVFGAGYINQNAVCVHNSAMAMRFDVPYSRSINVQVGFVLTLGAGTYVGSYTGAQINLQCTSIRSQQLPS